MAKLEIQWVTFVAPTRVSSSQSAVNAMAKGGATSLYLGRVQGETVVIVDDAGLAHPAMVPWSNVSGIGWVDPPVVEYVDAAEVPKSPAKAKAKFEVSA